VPPPLTVEYRLTPDIAARAADAFVRVRGRELTRHFRKAAAWFGLYAAFCAAAVTFAHLTGAEDWFALVLTAFAVISGGLFLLIVGLYSLALVRLRAAGRRCRREVGDDYTAAPAPTVRWAFTADGFETTLREQTRGVAWAGVRAFLATPEFWIVGVKGGPDLFLPREVAPAGVEALLGEKLGEPTVCGG
jgi:hypothetical protein